jgi:nucleoside 2-deoxyribosyltransferase
MRKKIYLASPLFNQGERDTNEKMCSTLERWCDVFLPQRDGQLITKLIADGVAVEVAYELVFRRDIAAIESCDAVVINLDGRSIDEGAAFEIGYAHALSKRCVGYRTDVRVLLEWGLNPMIVAPLSHVLRNLIELETWASDFARADIGAPTVSWLTSNNSTMRHRKATAS